MRPLAFVDLETTGATATSDRITEIGIIEVDEDGSVREWQQLVNPGTRIPPFIEQLTGISNELVATAPAFADVADETLRRLEGRLFIAHNARFDYGFLKNEFKRLGVAFRAPVLCTVKLSRSLFPEHQRHNLDSLIERHNLAVGARHRALADAQLIRQFWQKIHVDRSSDEIEAALKAQNARPSLPPHLDAGIVDDLPDTPGIYLFYAGNDLPLYVGKARDIRQRVLSHFSADHSSAREMNLAQQVRRIDWIETAGEIGALLKEAALVKELQPSHNRQLRRNDEVCTWTLVDEGEGWLRPELATARDLDFGFRFACYGLFRSSKEAGEALRALAAEGIQRGHMSLHAKQIALAAGAAEDEVAEIAPTRKRRSVGKTIGLIALAGAVLADAAAAQNSKIAPVPPANGAMTMWQTWRRAPCGHSRCAHTSRPGLRDGCGTAHRPAHRRASRGHGR